MDPGRTTLHLETRKSCCPRRPVVRPVCKGLRKKLVVRKEGGKAMNSEKNYRPSGLEADCHYHTRNSLNSNPEMLKCQLP